MGTTYVCNLARCPARLGGVAEAEVAESHRALVKRVGGGGIADKESTAVQDTMDLLMDEYAGHVNSAKM